MICQRLLRALAQLCNTHQACSRLLFATQVVPGDRSKIHTTAHGPCGVGGEEVAEVAEEAPPEKSLIQVICVKSGFVAPAARLDSSNIDHSGGNRKREAFSFSNCK